MRKIRIAYGDISLGQKGGGDWVFSTLEAFQRLEEVTFEVDCDGYEILDSWWECVRDAVREGLAGRTGMGKRGLRLIVKRVEVEKQVQ